MKDVFYQVSTLDALMLGNFDGVVTVKELLSHGSWGIGTYEGLDGEAIVCDGKAYDAHADGTTCEYGPQERMAFSTVADFSERAQEFAIDASEVLDSGDNLDAVKVKLEEIRTAYDDNDNAWFLVAMKGSFPFVHVRSCFKTEEKPYPTLPEVAGNQREFRYENEQGWVIGVWVPQYLNGINMPGWHVHYLSEDKQRGGHLLGLSVAGAAGKIQSYDHYEMQLPTNPEFKKMNLLEDLSAATKKVEG